MCDVAKLGKLEIRIVVDHVVDADEQVVLQPKTTICVNGEVISSVTRLAATVDASTFLPSITIDMAPGNNPEVLRSMDLLGTCLGVTVRQPDSVESH